jgi:hypothetical protein
MMILGSWLLDTLQPRSTSCNLGGVKQSPWVLCPMVAGDADC